LSGVEARRAWQKRTNVKSIQAWSQKKVLSADLPHVEM